MKYRIFFLIIIFFTILNAETITDEIHLKVGIYENAPKIFSEDNGEASGFWSEIINYIAKEESWELEWVKGNWEECLQRLESGEIDLLPDVAYNNERAVKYIFQKETTLLSWSRLYTRKGINIQTVFDLEGKKIAGLKGSYNLEGSEGLRELLNDFKINGQIFEMNSYIEVFEALDKGEVFAGVTNKDFGSRFENDYRVERTPIIFQPAGLYFAFSRKSEITSELIRKVDETVISLKDDKNSIYYKSLDKYLGGDREVSRFPLWAQITIAIILFLVLISVFFIWILKYEVNQKTYELRLFIIKLKKAEENLTKYRDQLEILVEKRTAELNEVNNELLKANLSLEEASKLKSQFLANMSHELRSPLNSIIGFSGIMIQGLAGELNEEQKKQLGMVYESAKHLLGLINDILDLSKIEAGKIKIYNEDMNIPALIDIVDKMMAPLATEKGLKLRCEISENTPEIIHNDRNRIKQVLINLLSNSVKFTVSGEIILSCKVTVDKRSVQFTVADSGIGIPADKQQTVFEEFTQIETLNNSKPSGTGLGLAISRKMVKMMAGEIWLESQFGIGTEFHFTIPVNKAEEGLSEFSEYSEKKIEIDASRKLILTIDDEEQSQKILDVYLSEAGYQIIQAYNYNEAIEFSTKYQPFAITLDIVMPGRDGWEIMEELKRNPGTRHIPIICISMLDNRNLSISMGAVEYLVKPVNSKRLLRELEQLKKQYPIKNILIIDDNPADLLLVQEYLAQSNEFNVVSAQNGKSGIEKIEQRKPDLIILDLMMPEMDGFEVITHLKAEEETKDIPVIIVSAKELDKEELIFLQQRIQGIISKDRFDEKQVLDDILSLIKRIEDKEQ
jgi:signal transduction histidine kinase/CheY-like chemotaxis protein